MTAPRLTREFVDLLTNPELIKRRANAAIAANRERLEGHNTPSPSQVLGNLKSYLNNALQNVREGSEGPWKKINVNNKRWCLSFGDRSCRKLLEYLGFDISEDWVIPPRPKPISSTQLNDGSQILLDDVLKELHVLLSLQDGHERRLAGADFAMASVAPPAIQGFRSLLGCLDYETNPGSQSLDTEEDEHPFYAGLGSVINFHDNLLSFAYDQQQVTDPANSPYYLQCLQGIAKGRKSESLHTKAAIEESSGKVSLDDIRSAYTALGLDPSLPVDEDTVIGTFQSRTTDAPRQEAELRRCLKIIGQHMASRRIEDFAADAVNTYEQALSWLGATAEMGDDFITSMFSLKVRAIPDFWARRDHHS